MLGGVPPIGSPSWCGSHRVHVHQGFDIAPNHVEGKGVIVGRRGDRETRAVGSPPTMMMTSEKVSVNGAAQR